VEFRADSPTGELLGLVAVPNTGGWGEVVTPTVDLNDPGRSITLYLVFTNPDWTSDKPDLLSVDRLDFNGKGVGR
jgi:cytochrome c